MSRALLSRRWSTSVARCQLRELSAFRYYHLVFVDDCFGTLWNSFELLHNEGYALHLS